MDNGQGGLSKILEGLNFYEKNKINNNNFLMEKMKIRA